MTVRLCYGKEKGKKRFFFVEVEEGKRQEEAGRKIKRGVIFPGGLLLIRHRKCCCDNFWGKKLFVCLQFGSSFRTFLADEVKKFECVRSLLARALVFVCVTVGRRSSQESSLSHLHPLASSGSSAGTVASHWPAHGGR